MSEADFSEVVDINLKGTFHCIHHVARPMLKQKSGRIINLASVVALHGNAGQVNYAASKAGIIGMTKSAAKELASRHITCLLYTSRDSKTSRQCQKTEHSMYCQRKKLLS